MCAPASAFLAPAPLTAGISAKSSMLPLGQHRRGVQPALGLKMGLRDQLGEVKDKYKSKYSPVPRLVHRNANSFCCAPPCLGSDEEKAIRVARRPLFSRLHSHLHTSMSSTLIIPREMSLLSTSVVLPISHLLRLAYLALFLCAGPRRRELRPLLLLECCLEHQVPTRTPHAHAESLS